MKSPESHILVNLARLSQGWKMTHVSRFLPELVAQRPGDSFAAVVPHEFAALVDSWGLTVCTSPVAVNALRSPLPWDRMATGTTGQRPDVILGPLSHVPLISRTPQMVWACQVPLASAAGDHPDTFGTRLSRVFVARSSLAIYPTAAARHMAELSGVKGPGLILRPPLRDVPPSAADRRTEHSSSGPLRVLVPANDEHAQNLALLPRLSTVLARRGVDHQIWVTGNVPSDVTSARVSGGFAYHWQELRELHDRVDVVLIPALAGSFCSPMVEFERLGFPVAASNIDAHVELRDRARLFDPASPHGAADALLAAVGDQTLDDPRNDQPAWRFSTPHAYAAALCAEIDRLIDGGELPWAV